MERTPRLDADAVARRFVGLTALRWIPTGLLIPVTVLLLQSRGLSLAEIGLLSAVQSLTVLVLELPTGGLADALGRRPLLVVAGVLDVAALALLTVGRSFSVLALAWFLSGIFRALESGPLEAWFVDSSLAADPAAPIERGLARAGTAIGLAISAGALTSALLGIASPADPFTTAVVIALALRVVDVAALYRYVEESPHPPPTPAIPLADQPPQPTAATAPPAATPQPGSPDGDHPPETSPSRHPDLPTQIPPGTAAVPVADPNPPAPQPVAGPSPRRHADTTAMPGLAPTRSHQDAGHPPGGPLGAPDGDHPTEGTALPPSRGAADVPPVASSTTLADGHGVSPAASLSSDPERLESRLARIRRAFTEVPGVVAGAVRLVAGHPALLALVGVELLWGAGLVTVELFSAPRLVELLGSRSEGLVVFGIVAALGWSIAGIGSAFTSRVVGWHGGAAWRAGASLRIAQGLAVLGIALVAGPAGLVVGYLGFYLVHGAANTVHYGMVHRLVGPEHRTTVVSANSLTSRIGSLAAAAGLGALASAHGIPAACLVAAGLLAAGAPLYRIAGRATA